eukprot:TRINITY_DN16072_c0_g1_i1.p1 TRINITY_DN16072_c0_g1~~TRINITY_DN16072_c0_g1_i1.p1  ORF type:complete len:404 (-),score=60.37 TRINITY_DN16072_c0_g1_i1:171-1325(-)
MAQEFQCSVCMCIVNEPSQTVCDHVFCAECVAPSLACPICRTTLGDGDKKPLRECNKPMLRMLNALKVWCPYHQQSKVSNVESSATSPAQDEQSGEEPAAKRARMIEQGGKCDWTGSYIDLLAKHIAECPFHLVPCPRGCGKMLVRRDLEHHEPECSKNFEECPICRSVIKVGLMGQHRKEKAELHVQLLEAKLAEKESQPLEEVLASLQDRLASVETAVKASATREDVNGVKACVDARVSSLSGSIDRIQQCVSSLANNTVLTQRKSEWEISDFACIKQRNPKGRSILSKAFNLVGAGPFRIVFYPNGELASEAGKCTLRLRGPPTVKVKAKLQVGENSRTFPAPMMLNDDPGWTNFCSMPNAASLLISIEIIDIQVVTSSSA